MNTEAIEPTTTTTEQLPEILIRSEAAKFLRMSERHFMTLVHEGVLPEIKAGQRKRLYRKTSLVKALEEGQG